MKTLTLQVDDKTYNMLKLAADNANKNLSDFVEYLAFEYLNSNYVDDTEMEEILHNESLLKSIHQGLKEAQNGDYEIV
jgi:hypothetical protein